MRVRIFKVVAALLLLSIFLVTRLYSQEQTIVVTRNKDIITKDGKSYRDLNDNGLLDPYEDWSLPVSERVENLLSLMTLEEKAGMMLIDTLNAGYGGEVHENALNYILGEHMTRFVFRNPVVKEVSSDHSQWRGGVTPYETAKFTNKIQEIAESSRLGIPVLFKSNARNHYTYDSRAYINVTAGAFSEWPKEAGLAATRDMGLIRKFAKTISSEWKAVGLRGMYGYMADLATEPRWYRIHETFTEDSKLASDIMTNLVKGMDGVMLTMKHFPGGGPQEGGADPHYSFGKNQSYTADMFDYHLEPFKAAIDAGLAAIMPYYGIPVGQDYQPNNVGMAFSKGIITELLREKLGFQGVVNSDTGIIGTRAWGLEDTPALEQVALAIDAGTDVLSGFNNHRIITYLVEVGRIEEESINASVRRLLTVQFNLGLFENPYVDSAKANDIVGSSEFQTDAQKAQRSSIVLLKNDAAILPVKEGKVTLINSENISSIPDDTEYPLIRISVNNDGARRDLVFGGANPEELDFLSFSDMSRGMSWNIEPSLDEIREVMNRFGPEKTILSIYFRQPYVLDEESGLKNAAALLATFGVCDEALLDIVTGEVSPRGKLPFALANSAEAIVTQDSDAPGYSKKETLYPFGYGLEY